jgi:hypothetical protein
MDKNPILPARFFFFFPPLLYPKIFPRPTYHLPPPVLPTTYLPPSYLPPTNPSPTHSIARAPETLSGSELGAGAVGASAWSELGAGAVGASAWSLEEELGAWNSASSWSGTHAL